MSKNINLTLKVWRQKDATTKGAFENYQVADVSTDSSFLEMMDVLNEQLVNDGKENYVKNSKFEKKLVEIFFKNSDPLTGLKILKKELQEIYELSKEIRDFNNFNDNKLSRKKMLKHLEQVFFLKIKKNYFSILLGIVNDYFNKEIKFSEDYIEEKIDKMWR